MTKMGRRKRKKTVRPYNHSITTRLAEERNGQAFSGTTKAQCTKRKKIRKKKPTRPARLEPTTARIACFVVAVLLDHAVCLFSFSFMLLMLTCPLGWSGAKPELRLHGLAWCGSISVAAQNPNRAKENKKAITKGNLPTCPHARRRY